MATPAQIIANIETRLANQWPVLVNVQNRYFNRHGRYAQGLRTHTILPSEGVDAAADRLNARPTDQAESWNDLATENGFSFPATNIAALQIDAYNGLEGHGWSASLTVKINNKFYKRTVNVGPETWRSMAWRIIEAVEGGE